MVAPILNTEDSVEQLKSYKSNESTTHPGKIPAFKDVAAKHADPDSLSTPNSALPIRKTLRPEDMIALMIQRTKMQGIEDNDKNSTESMMNATIAMTQMQNIEQESKNNDRAAGIALFGSKVELEFYDEKNRKYVHKMGLVKGCRKENEELKLMLDDGTTFTLDQIKSIHPDNNQLKNSMAAILGTTISGKIKSVSGKDLNIQGTAMGIIQDKNGNFLVELENGNKIPFDAIDQYAIPMTSDNSPANQSDDES